LGPPHAGDCSRLLKPRPYTGRGQRTRAVGSKLIRQGRLPHTDITVTVFDIIAPLGFVFSRKNTQKLQKLY
jgi:hypothetical protein